MSHKNKLVFLFSIALLCISHLATAQTPVGKPITGAAVPLQPKAASASAIQPYDKVITSAAKSFKGFIEVHKIDDRYFFEIADSILNRDLFSVNRISKAAAELRLMFNAYVGDAMGSEIFRFQKTPNKAIQLVRISLMEKSSDTSTNGLSRVLMDNSVQSIIQIFPIKALNPAKGTYVIDMTDFFATNNQIFGTNKALSGYLPRFNILTDRSRVLSVKAYPGNIEISHLRTIYADDTKSTYTFEMNNSIVLLPKQLMKSRNMDPRVGYFALNFLGYKDFDSYPNATQMKMPIWRFRVEPRPEDEEKYFRGELVEPKKPIIFYIDPNTPKKWIPYLIAGVNDWQKAFEHAGFKNAIFAREVAKDDTTWSITDSRYNVIVYKPTGQINAVGNSIQDPRTGETLESHVDWYHSVTEMLYKWYFIQAGAIDERARKPELDDELMGSLIRFVSSHEIGHTLGLRHNWGASNTVPVENLRNKKWVEAHGHTPSIMDYARFNYVAQPEDHIGPLGIYPRVGDYDTWAIEWGYRLYPRDLSEKQETELMNKKVVDKLASGPQFRFGIERLDPNIPSAPLDPRNQNEDLGDDAILASEYGIKNLKRIEPNLLKWTMEPGEDYSKAGEMYLALVDQFKRYCGHVSGYISGLTTDPKVGNQQGDVYKSIPKAKQKAAMAFLVKELFNTPYWLMDEKLFALTRKNFGAVETAQRGMIKSFLDPYSIIQMRQLRNFDGNGGYSFTEIQDDLRKGLFTEIETGGSVTLNRRNLQKTYVSTLLAVLKTSSSNEADEISVLKDQAKILYSKIGSLKMTKMDQVTRDHYLVLRDDIYNSIYRPIIADRNRPSK